VTRDVWYRTKPGAWSDGGLLLSIYASMDLSLAREQTRLIASLEELDELRKREEASFRSHVELRRAWVLARAGAWLRRQRQSTQAPQYERRAAGLGKRGRAQAGPRTVARAAGRRQGGGG